VLVRVLKKYNDTNKMLGLVRLVQDASKDVKAPASTTVSTLDLPPDIFAADNAHNAPFAPEKAAAHDEVDNGERQPAAAEPVMVVVVTPAAGKRAKKPKTH
jgi:hypothetical protein